MAGKKGTGRRTEPLADYADKRDFARTPEPRPETGGAAAEGGAFPRFVVQEHHASHLHWDLRLEMDGVLKSWAVPKGPPLEPGVRRLAMQVEDHPLDYIDFAGIIPAGNYGSGTVEIWDEGRYALVERMAGKIVFAALGRRLQGGYALVHTRENQWLLMKMAEDRPATRDSQGE